MPYSLSLRRPSSLIQSVVQAGDSTVRIFGCAKAFALQRQLDFERDHVHRGTAGIGRRDRDLDAAIADRDIAKHAEIGDGEHRNFGIDHLRRDIPRALPQFGIAVHGDYHVAPGNVRCIDCNSLRRWPRCSLCRPLRPPCCIQSLLGKRKRRFAHDIGNRLEPLRPQRRGIDRDACIDQAAFAVVDLEHLAGKAQRSSIAVCARRWLSSVPSPSRTIHSERMPHMIGAFLLGFRRDRRQRRIAGLHHRAPIEVGESRVEKLPHHGAREIAVRLLQQQQIAVLPDVAQIGEFVLVVALAFDLGGIGIEFARLPEQIEAHIGERHVLFHARRMAAPFRQPMPQDQRVVGPAQRIQHQRRFGDLDRGGGHIQFCLYFPTSS